MAYTIGGRMSQAPSLFGTPIVKDIWIFAEYWTKDYYPNHPFRITLFTDHSEMKEFSEEKAYKAKARGFSGYNSDCWKISWDALVRLQLSPRF